MPLMLAVCSLFIASVNVDAAVRPATRGTATARRNVTTATTATQTTTNSMVEEIETEPEPVEEQEDAEQQDWIISNKSNQFNTTVSEIMTTATEDNSFAEQIRKQRAALAASEASYATTTAQKNALSSNSSSCDVALRKCMSEKCGSDFTKCALDGDTLFGDKLNRCKQDSNCSGEEFSLFTAEIKADRDMNVRLASYNTVLDCGNSYNACIVNECGTTYNKCLGKKNSDAAIQKCSAIAKECAEADSGLPSRFGTVIGKLRESAETDVKKDEERMYKLRDLMKQSCEKLGARFDERTFDCVYTVNFFAGENQSTPIASRKRYAGDTFVCMQEWFGVNATSYQENAYRETRAQTAASSAMLGSGLGTAAGLVTSGAMDRALDTQKAKKAYKEECKENEGKKWKNGKCIDINEPDSSPTPPPTENGNDNSTQGEIDSSSTPPQTGNDTNSPSDTPETSSGTKVSISANGTIDAGAKEMAREIKNKIQTDQAIQDIKDGKPINIPKNLYYKAPNLQTSYGIQNTTTTKAIYQNNVRNVFNSKK